MEGSNDEQPQQQERALSPAPQRSKWNPLATPKRVLLSVLVVVLSAGVFVGVRALQPPQVPTGHTKWSRQIGTMWHSAPTVSNGVVYIGTEENKVFALSAAAGKMIWSVQLGIGDESSGIHTLPGSEQWGGLCQFAG